MNVGVLIWLIIGLPLMLVVSWLAGRLLGSRRGIVQTLFAGVIGFSIAVLTVLQVSQYNLDDNGLVRDVFVLGLIMTMLTNVTMDLLTKPKHLREVTLAQQAGIPETTRLPLPIHRSRNAIEPINRYRQIVGIARRNGLGVFLGKSAKAEADARPLGDRLCATLEECGGMFVKLGQVASTRSDLLPAEITEALRSLQSDMPPADADAITALLEAELGQPVDIAFAEFERTPIAAASIGQAHRARLHTGEDVIVKVQRPGVDDLVARDTRALMQLARTVRDHTAFGARYDVDGMAGEFVRSIEQELDFRIEARNGLAIAANVATKPDAAAVIVVPMTHPEFSSRKVLVQERLPGVPLGDGSVLESMDVDRAQLASLVLDTFLQQMLFDGIYHADPHPGNVFVLPDGRLGLIDFGAVGLLDELTRQALQEMVLAVLNRDPHRLRQAVGTITTISPDTDDIALERALSQFMTEHVQPGQGIDARALNDLAPLFGRFGIALPTQLTTFGRTLVTLEGTLKMISPDFALADGVQQLAAQWMNDIVTAEPEELLKQGLIENAPMLRRLPSRVDDLTAQLAAGQFVARMRLFSDERDVAVVSKLINRIVLVMVAAALGFASVALIITDAGPEFAGEATLMNVVGYLGLFGAMVLLTRVTAQIVREGLN